MCIKSYAPGLRCVAAVFAWLAAACTGGDADPVDVPDLPYCDPVADWPDEWVDFELEVLALTNQHRRAGATCPITGDFAPTHALVLDPALVCAARVHSMDMYVRSFWSHENPDGELPGDRMENAGYLWSRAGENIAKGQDTPEEAVRAWMESTDGHCDAVMNPDWVHIGVGFFPDGGPYWTQTFAAPR